MKPAALKCLKLNKSHFYKNQNNVFYGKAASGLMKSFSEDVVEDFVNHANAGYLSAGKTLLLKLPLGNETLQALTFLNYFSKQFEFWLNRQKVH